MEKSRDRGHGYIYAFKVQNKKIYEPGKKEKSDNA